MFEYVIKIVKILRKTAELIFKLRSRFLLFTPF